MTVAKKTDLRNAIHALKEVRPYAPTPVVRLTCFQEHPYKRCLPTGGRVKGIPYPCCDVTSFTASAATASPV